MAPRVIRVLKPLHHVKVAVQGGVKEIIFIFFIMQKIVHILN